MAFIAMTVSLSSTLILERNGLYKDAHSHQISAPVVMETLGVPISSEVMKAVASRVGLSSYVAKKYH